MMFFVFFTTPQQVTDHQHEELKLVREHIRTCFESVACFLMPHPGLKVATSLDSDGRLDGGCGYLSMGL